MEENHSFTAPAATESTALLHQQQSPLSQEQTKKKRGLIRGRAVSRCLEKWVPFYGRHASLSTAWDYLEEMVLPRRLKNTYQKTAGGEETELYDAWTTPQSALAGFGTGIAVYFETLRILAVILFMAYVLYLPSIWYYASQLHDPENAGSAWWGWYDLPLRGSLMCRHTVWVPCVDCQVNDFPTDRLAVSSDTNVLFVLKNDCSPMRWAEGVNHLVVVIFVTISMIWLGFFQKKLELKYDESVLTASDFSIVVLNPPKGSVDVEEWKAFFETHFGKVVYCTITLDNHRLVKALLHRRVCLFQAIHEDDTSETIDDDAGIQRLPERVRVTAPRLAAKCDDAEAKCHAILQEKKEYNATRVFVTFEYEKSQRSALKALLSRNPKTTFRNGHVLRVKEAMEPSVVRWSDLEETQSTRWTQRGCACVITIVFMYIALQTVWYAFGISVKGAAVVVAMFSSMAHTFFGLINHIESHEEESSYQASLFCKLMAFRFVNTVVTTMLITPFTETVGEKSTSLIPAIYTVLLAEVFITPLVNVMDPVGHCYRLLLAPFAKNQAAMNSYFKGSPENFGNRYTNMTKIVLLCLFYATIFPSGLLFGSLALVITYFTDKFLLLRTWAPIPELGNNVARLSRRLIFPFCLIVLLLMSELYWSAFPFDNACASDDSVGSTQIATKYAGVHNLLLVGTRQPIGQVVVAGTDALYRYCDQNYLEHLSGLLAFFKMETDEWMSDDQQYLTYVFGLICVTFAMIMVVVECKYDLLPLIGQAFWGGYITEERDSKSKFSDKPDIRVYVPQALHPLLSFPLLACDTRGIETSRIGWTFGMSSHMYHSMQNDVTFLMTDKKPLGFPVLSIVQRWE